MNDGVSRKLFSLAFSVAGGNIASALAAGCPVVVKVHPAIHVPDLLDGKREAPDC
jgi:hypothetical protein